MTGIDEISELLIASLKGGGKILTFGVGGNAANAIHFAAEMAGKYEEFEDPLPCIDLCSNPSVLTAITNDFGWDVVFSRQILALGNTGDVVVAFSISTRARYLKNAYEAALKRGCLFVLISGATDCYFGPIEGRLFLDSEVTPFVQEWQLEVIHALCGKVKSRLEVTLHGVEREIPAV